MFSLDLLSQLFLKNCVPLEVEPPKRWRSLRGDAVFRERAELASAMLDLQAAPGDVLEQVF